MKKILKTLVPLAIVLTVGCSKKDSAPGPFNCVSNSTKLSETLTAYAANPTKAGCEAYKKAVRDYVNSCATYYTAVDKKEFEESLAEPCPN